jgi:hypothetical protein
MPLAARDMAPLGEKLRVRIARIRAFLLERFSSLRKLKTSEHADRAEDAT